MSDQALITEQELRERVGVLEAENARLLAQIAQLTKNVGLNGNEMQKTITELTQANFKLQSQLRDAEARERKQAHLLFAMSRDKKKKTATEFTAKRELMKLEELRVMKEELAKWMKGVLHIEFVASTLIDVLTTGVILCDLLKLIDPSLVNVMGKIHDRAGPGSFLAHDNLKAFLRGCTQLGVPIHELFDTSALAKQNQESRTWKEERSVLYCLLAVSRCATKFGFDPPDIVRLEQEIEAIRSKSKGFESGLPSASHNQGGTAEEIDMLVQLCTKELGLPHPPAKLRPGEYQFNQDTIAHVRVIRGVALVRYQNNWTELAPFMAQIAEAPPRDARISVIEGGQSKGKSAKVGFVDEDPEMMVGMSGEEDDSKGDSEGGTTEHTGRPRIKAHTDEAKKEFFFLTALAVKLNHNLREDVCLVDTTDLWRKANQENIDFYHFATWVEKELTKTYLEAARRDRMDFITRKEAQHVKEPPVDGPPLAVPTEIPNRHGNEPISSVLSSHAQTAPQFAVVEPRHYEGSGSTHTEQTNDDLRRHRSTVTKALNQRKEQALKEKLAGPPLDK